ncbi:MAG TPA: DoxX family protein [Chloroflexota bacterium]|nr:DoxX family protein [Chloroflexota bacterium]
MKNVAVWGLQVLLALAFGAAGVMKIVTPVDQLVANGMAWTSAVPPIAVTLIGVAEILGAVGLILPAATRIRPELTPAAAAGLGVTQVLAAVFHVTRGEGMMVPVNLVLALLAFGVFAARRSRGAW